VCSVLCCALCYVLVALRVIESKSLTVGSKIGWGGSKVVFRGLWNTLNVAVGRLRDFDDDDARASFLTELRTAWTMLHPHLVEVYALAADDSTATTGQLCTVAEPLYCSLFDAIHYKTITSSNSKNGGSSSSNSKTGGGSTSPPSKGGEGEKSFLLSVPDHSVASRAYLGLSYLQKLRLMVGLASAVAFLHEHKIIHRDINSRNVLVGYATRPLGLVLVSASSGLRLVCLSCSSGSPPCGVCNRWTRSCR